MYQTDGDNYIDLCLQLNSADDNGKSIQAVQINANAVFPPRGTGPNTKHMVKVDHMVRSKVIPKKDDEVKEGEEKAEEKAEEKEAEEKEAEVKEGEEKEAEVKDEGVWKDPVYPYNLEMESFGDKLENLYMAEIAKVFHISIPTGMFAILTPIVGIGLSIGVLFLDAFKG